MYSTLFHLNRFRSVKKFENLIIFLSRILYSWTLDLKYTVFEKDNGLNQSITIYTLHTIITYKIRKSFTEKCIFRFEKLQFLLQQNPFPPETLGNLLLLYGRYQCFDLAADVLADYTHLTHKYLSPVSLEYHMYL